jgi:hypothetical protein
MALPRLTVRFLVLADLQVSSWPALQLVRIEDYSTLTSFLHFHVCLRDVLTNSPHSRYS